MVTRSRKSRASSRALGLTPFQTGAVLLASVAFLVPWVIAFPGLSVQGHRVFSVFLLAVVLWVTEAVPLYATAALIILLQIGLVSDQAVLPLPEDFQAPSYTTFYHALASPILMLFLGGFFLADGAAKFRLDRNLAAVMLRPFGSSPAMILMGMMAITALFSMFMSNTATTATMMAVALPVVAGLPEGDRMRAGFALAIPVAANIGGLGTPIGTPPNAIAIGALGREGVSITFLQWMAMAVPLMLVLLAGAWALIAVFFRGPSRKVSLDLTADFDHSPGARIFYAVFGLTVLLWLSEPLHGIKSTVVGFVPVVILLLTRVFDARDLQNVQWHVLWLVAGGIALGSGVGNSGLDHWLLGLVQWDGMSRAAVVLTLGLVGLLFSNLISHSATANLLVPLGVSLAAMPSLGLHPALAASMIAMSCSLGMSLPISTPPNAIAVSTGMVKTKDMAPVGALVGAAGWLLLAWLGPSYWGWLGVLNP